MYRRAIRTGLLALLMGTTLAIGWMGHGTSVGYQGHGTPQTHTIAGGGGPIWPPPAG